MERLIDKYNNRIDEIKKERIGMTICDTWRDLKEEQRVMEYVVEDLENLNNTEASEKPAWLETLWNVNPRLAEAAEKDVVRWQKIDTSQDQALNLAGVSGSLPTDEEIDKAAEELDTGTFGKWTEKAIHNRVGFKKGAIWMRNLLKGNDR